jgi:hypothetical protein
VFPECHFCYSANCGLGFRFLFVRFFQNLSQTCHAVQPEIISLVEVIKNIEKSKVQCIVRSVFYVVWELFL